MIDVYMERFEHPYLLTLVPVAVLLFLLSVIAELGGMHMAAGFLVLYGVNALIILLFGYAVYFGLKVSTQKIRRFRIRRQA